MFINDNSCLVDVTILRVPIDKKICPHEANCDTFSLITSHDLLTVVCFMLFVHVFILLIIIKGV